MPLLVAVLLAVIQGVFMFVPVSSTSHLALAQHVLDDRGVDIPAPESAEMILFDLVLHLGTVVSIVVVFRRRLLEGGRRLVAELRQRLGRAAPGTDAGPPVATRTLVLLALATGVTGVVGLGVREVAPEVFARPWVIALALIVTGAILWWTDRSPPGTVTATTLGAGAAIGIGLAQALALFPGLSRSGLTIAAALALGLTRRTAAEFSFVLAIPTIVAATGVQAALVVRSGDALTLGADVYVVGFVVAALVGTVALVLVLRLLLTARFRYFTPYVWLLAAAVLVVGPDGG
ncbi:MAG: undecaprenyl-diphosphate phosphatase [Acidimicrobiia bacterium]|nr:undecaprenyl-diphosphate phosphatase [Acidimicrobiia bacterium]